MARVWNRALALCGVGFVVVTFIGAGIEGSVPHPDASTAAIVKFYASHKTHVEVGTVVMADAVVLILLFAANLLMAVSVERTTAVAGQERDGCNSAGFTA